MPLERCLYGVSRNSRTSAKSTISSNLSSMVALAMPCSPAASRMFSRTERSPTNPPVISINGATPPRTSTVPSSGMSTPATSFSSVDLPCPLAPTSPMDSPGATSKDTLRRAQNDRTSFPPLPLNRRSRALRCRRPVEKRIPTSVTEMMGVSIGSDLLEHGGLEPGEHGGAHDQQQDGDHDRRQHVEPIDLSREEGRAIQRQDAGERVQREDTGVGLRDVHGAVDHRGDVEPEAQHYPHDPLEVTDQDDQGGQEQPDPREQHHLHEEGKRREDHLPMQPGPVQRSEQRDHRQAAQELDALRRHESQDPDLAPDVGRADQLLVHTEGARRVDDRVVEPGPGQQTRQQEDDVGLLAHGPVEDRGEYEPVHRCHEQRIEDGPDPAERRARVADLEIAYHE